MDWDMAESLGNWMYGRYLLEQRRSWERELSIFVKKNSASGAGRCGLRLTTGPPSTTLPQPAAFTRHQIAPSRLPPITAKSNASLRASLTRVELNRKRH